MVWPIGIIGTDANGALFYFVIDAATTLTTAVIIDVSAAAARCSRCERPVSARPCEDGVSGLREALATADSIRVLLEG